MGGGYSMLFVILGAGRNEELQIDSGGYRSSIKRDLLISVLIRRRRVGPGTGIPFGCFAPPPRLAAGTCRDKRAPVVVRLACFPESGCHVGPRFSRATWQSVT
jgi:hypothetical protein